MSTLEIILSAILALALWQLISIHRKQLIIRHLFVHSSDWCARKIDEIVESAEYEIVGWVKRDDGHSITDEDARDYIPFTILNAKGEWEQQKDAFQARLRLNGIRPLDDFDLDTLTLNPDLVGFKRRVAD
jgi:hypothetical protein